MEKESLVVLLHPQKTWVFIVGNNKEWPDERETIGDIGLYHSFLQYGIPRHRIRFLKDDHATLANIQNTFLQMLVSFEDDLISDSHYGDDIGLSLVVYYGGHGEKHHFSTIGGNWRHKDLIEVVEEHASRMPRLRITVWIFADSCYAGNIFGVVKEVKRHQRESSTDSHVPNTSYVCLMSTQANTKANYHWVMTQCLIRAMQQATSSSAPKYYNLDELVGHMADETAQIKCDLMTVGIYTQHDTDIFGKNGNAPLVFFAPLKIGCSDALKSPFSHNKSMASENDTVPSKSWTGVLSCKAGDEVYAKWEGGPPKRSSITNLDAFKSVHYIPPVWFRATVRSIRRHDSTAKEGERYIKNDFNADTIDEFDNADVTFVQVEMFDPSTRTRWKTVVEKRHLLHSSYFTSYSNFDAFVNAQLALAKQLQFTTHIFQSGTKVRARWIDGKTYSAIVAPVLDLPWNYILDNMRDVTGNASGALVPVYWQTEDSYSLVPIKKVTCIDKGKTHHHERNRREESASCTNNKVRKVPEEITTERQAIMCSFWSAGKRICQVKNIYGTREVMAYWEETRCWYPAITVDNPDDIPLTSLAYHALYKDEKEFCAVEWKDEETVSFLPISHIKKREGG